MENNTGKYLKYALGEIILVVIGILIALQLNTWKAEQVDREKEQVHLQDMKEDLQIQMEVIHAQVEHENELAILADSALSFFSGGISLAELEDILYGSSQLGFRKTFVESDASFNELLATGGMNLISDSELRTSIMRYYQRLDYTTKVINTNNGLTDALFNINASNNAPSFSLDSQGVLETSVELTGQERYRLSQSITMRKDLCNIALRICEEQRVATIELIEQLENALNR